MTSELKVAKVVSPIEKEAVLFDEGIRITGGDYPIVVNTLAEAEALAARLADGRKITVVSDSSSTPPGLTTTRTVSGGLATGGVAEDASGVRFTPAGVGAVARTAQDKMREVVSVKDFGAIGDGVTDDTAAIQAAIDYVFSAGGGAVYAPPGNYLLSSFRSSYYTVRARSRVSVFGSGPRTIFKIADGMVSSTQGVAFLYDHDNPIDDATYKDFTVDWNGQNNPNPNTPVGNTTRFGSNGGPTNLHITGVTFLNPGGHHNIWISGAGAKNCSVKNCVFINAGRSVADNTLITDHSSIYVDCSQVTIEGNIFFCENLNDTVATAVEMHGNNVTCQNNIIYGYSLGVIAGASENTGNNLSCKIKGNIFDSVIECVRIHAAFTHANDLFVVEGNTGKLRTIIGRASFGVRTLSESSSVCGALSVIGNLFAISSLADTITPHIGIFVTDWATVDISGNTLRDFPGEGVFFGAIVGNAFTVAVRENQLLSCGVNTGSVKRAVAVLAESGRQVEYSRVLGNTLICTASFPGTTAAQYGVQTFGNIRRLEVIDNEIEGQTLISVNRDGVDATAVTLIRHVGNEDPFNNINATFGSEYRSRSSSRVWQMVIPASNGSSDGWRSTEYSAASPTTGRHSPGDRAVNQSPSVGQPKAWSCTEFGTPGTFVSEGNL